MIALAFLANSYDSVQSWPTYKGSLLQLEPSELQSTRRVRTRLITKSRKFRYSKSLPMAQLLKSSSHTAMVWSIVYGIYRFIW